MVRVRFAPSPTGRLHVGSAHTALFNWLFARHHGGAFVLRIEDTDRSRVVEGALEDILEGLRWLGLDWDEGPYFQSERVEIYRRHADVLLERGWAYRCFCSPERLERMRREQQARGEPPKYDRRCRDLPPDEVKGRVEAGEPNVIRLKVPLEGETKFVDLIRGEIVFRNSELDDLILLKSDGFPTYHLASVVDDHLMGITHVLRAEEWISSTPKHVLLYEAFGWEPPNFAHLPLILGPDKSKLSKRHGATALLDYRDKGYLPEAMANFLALLGWSPGDGREKLSGEEMIEEFSLEGMGKRGSVFDETKLEWLNGLCIRELPPEQLF
ncbi:MAG TPA: glutamate--tRNA ligase, partial [Candidatus Latescibacteria bacterium]|nr:glutamate--tRNA ligase [Candidatus Latescibacterota bacterium]